MTEHDEQAAVMDWYWSVGQYRWPDLFIYANANAGRMSYGAAAHMRAEGRTAGIPDLFVANPRGGFHGLYIEMKYGKGKLSDAQFNAINRLIENGYLVHICYSAKEAISAIVEHMSLKV